MLCCVIILLTSKLILIPQVQTHVMSPQTFVFPFPSNDNFACELGLESLLLVALGFSSLMIKLSAPFPIIGNIKQSALIMTSTLESQ